MDQNNIMMAAGRITEDFILNKEIKIGKEVSTSFLEITRDSGTVDRIMVLIENDMLQSANYLNKRVGIKGRFSSYNKHGKDRTKLLLFIYIEDIVEISDDVKDMNVLYMSGFLCKLPTYRVTPFGREISDILIAVRRYNNSSDYIPCIAWGKTAKESIDIPVGSKLMIKGRVQSRKYTKQICERYEEMVAYEVSISELLNEGSQ